MPLTNEAAVHALDSIGGYFTENRGQVNGLVRYYSAGNPAVAFRDDGVLFVLTEWARSALQADGRHPVERPMNANVDQKPSESVAYMVRFEGANPVSPVGKGELPFKSNFFHGNDDAAWRTGVKNYREVVYRNLYDGVDLTYRATDRSVKYELVVEPGANWRVISFSYDGVAGAELDAAGNIRVRTALGIVMDTAPTSFQGDDRVTCSFVPRGGRSYGFDCNTVDTARTLVIDPLVYSTYVGGSADDRGISIAVDSAGNSYITGGTSVGFPTTPGAFHTTSYGGGEAFVAKLNATGSGLVYSTYLGGSGGDAGWGIAVDDGGDAYVTGTTSSADFPYTPGAVQSGYGVFITRLSAAGDSLIYSASVGGSSQSQGWGIAIDSARNAFVTGYTYASNFPVTADAFQASKGGWSDAFVTEISPTGDSIVYSTFLGGVEHDAGSSIAVDAAYSVYVTGGTWSSDFPVTPGAFDTDNSLPAPTCKAFVVKFSGVGMALVYSTYLGGHLGTTGGNSIKADSDGSAYVTGVTSATDFPVTSGAFDVRFKGVPAFVTKLSMDGKSLVYSTYLSGSSYDNWGESISVDAAGSAYVIGSTGSADFPLTAGAIDVILNGSSDVYVARLDPTGRTLLYGTYLGGANDECKVPSYCAIAVDGAGNAYVTGWTDSPDFPVTPGSFDTSYNGGHDLFVTKLMPKSGGKTPKVSGLGAQGFTSDPGIGHVTDLTPDLNWTYFDADGDPQAQYLLRVGSAPRTSDLWKPPLGFGTTNIVTYAGSPLVRGGYYHFGIRVYDGQEWSGEEELVFHVNTIPYPPVEPVVPANNSMVQASPSQTVFWNNGGDQEMDLVTFGWEVSTDVTFATIEASGTTTAITSDTFVTVPSTNYFWRVRARDDYEPMNWSDYGNAPLHYWTFKTTSLPIVSSLGVQGFTSPPGIVHITDFSPDLNWTYLSPDGRPQAWFDVRVGSAPGAGDMGDPPPTPGAETVITYAGLPLLRTGDYYFAVRVNDSVETSAEVEVMFHVNSIPNDPRTPVSPPQSSTVPVDVAQTVSWTSGLDNEGDQITFEWQVSTDTSFATTLSSGMTIGTTSSSFPTNPFTTYYWRVRARDDWEPPTWSGYGNTPPGYWTFGTSPPNTPPTISVTSPVGGEIWNQATSHPVTWVATDNEDAPSSLVVFINYTSSAGSGSICGPVVGNLGSCLWTLPTITATDVVVNGTVIDTGGLRGYDESGPFTIQAPSNTPPTMTITSPSGGEVYARGSVLAVTWTVSDNEDPPSALLVWINYTSGAGSGNICNPITCSVGSYSWTLPMITATDVVVNGTVADTGGLKGYDESGQFTIRAQPPANTPPTVTITSPSGGENWAEGSSRTIIWTMHDNEDVNANLTVYINYTTGGVTSQIAAALKGQLSSTWTLPDVEANDVVVNITVIDTGGLKGWSQSGPFTIKAPPPPEVAANYKPIVALIFAIILLVAGIWSSKKKPWKGGKDRMAVAKAFAIFSLPFVLAEATTGVISLLTGQLSMPPLVGAGTSVDLAILLAGMVVAVLQIVRTKPSGAEETSTPLKR